MRAPLGAKALLSLFLAAMMVAVSAPQASANPLYAAIVIDAKTGETLFSRNADARRFPASLTKMMTLYMVFEAMSNGRISASTRIPVSAKAAAEPPTKIGLRAGSTITVDDAIKALVVRSANDISTAVGEFLGGSEARFAQMMTAKARQLGMNSTQFRNAHGLPNQQQYTTARDMARLGVALREHFPQYYSYFSTRSATIAGRAFNSHNRLLGRVTGADGIKTGFIRSSGFNLVSSVQSGNRSVVAVVMGGRSARTRDDHMVALIREHMPRASTRGGGQLIARGAPAPVVAGAVRTASLPGRNAPIPAPRPGAAPVANAYAAAAPAQAAQAAVAAAASAAVRPQAPVGLQEIGEGDMDPVQTSSIVPPSGAWVIQIASMDSEAEAKKFLAGTAARAPRVLANAQPFTERFNNNGRLYFRARYGGFDSAGAARNACNALKSHNIACYAVQR